MDTTMNAEARSTHPLVIIAALAVTLFSAVGIAALMGWLPSSTGSQPAPTAVSAFDAKTQSASLPATPEREVTKERPAAAKAPVAARATTDKPAPRSTPAPKATPPVQVAAAEPHTTAPAPQPPVAVSQPQPAPVPAPVVAAEPPRPALCVDCGVIESVRPVQQQSAASGIGAVAGGVLGGIVGHQVGAGRGRDLATVVGAVGGAVAGNQIEKGRNVSTNYEVTVRFDDNTTQRLTLAQAPTWRAGDRVRVVNGSIRPL